MVVVALAAYGLSGMMRVTEDVSRLNLSCVYAIHTPLPPFLEGKLPQNLSTVSWGWRLVLKLEDGPGDDERLEEPSLFWHSRQGH